MTASYANFDVAQDGFTFRCPNDLARTATNINRVLLIGQCTSDHLRYFFLEGKIDCDFVHIQSLTDPEFSPPNPIESYDFQIVVLPLDRFMLQDAYFALSYADTAGEQRRFEEATSCMHALLDTAMRFRDANGLLTFVGNFPVPQQNPVGRLLPRYDLRNPCYFVEKLNESLSHRIESIDNAYMVDIDGIAASFGKKSILDDSVWALSHGGFITNFEYDNFDSQRTESQKRLEELGPISAYYNVGTHGAYIALREEIVALYRSVRQIDAVKLVVIDLDDTAWRGIAAEEDNSLEFMTLGWPTGFIEALMFLKRRGILLAIVSKNERANAEKSWNSAYGRFFPLSNFASIKVNWNPKSQNIQEILSETHLLSRNVVYVDDNPAERRAIQAVFPDLRVLGANPYYTRRILLWSAETQVPFISSESVSRTTSVQAVIQRESDRTRMTHEEFLNSLRLQIREHHITSTSAPYFSRTLELLNKTNQFNTTGKRWTAEELSTNFQENLVAVVLEVSDRFNDYGIVCIALLRDNTIEQIVMSCRVIGLGVEKALMALVLHNLQKQSWNLVRAFSRITDKNVLSRDLFKAAGFNEIEDGIWTRALLTVPALPTHITMELVHV